MKYIAQNDTSFVDIVITVLEILSFMFFQNGVGGHLGFRGQDEPKIFLKLLQKV